MGFVLLFYHHRSDDWLCSNHCTDQLTVILDVFGTCRLSRASLSLRSGMHQQEDGESCWCSGASLRSHLHRAARMMDAPLPQL